MFSTFDLCLLLYVIRLAGWLKHCNLSLSLSPNARADRDPVGGLADLLAHEIAINNFALIDMIRTGHPQLWQSRMWFSKSEENGVGEINSLLNQVTKQIPTWDKDKRSGMFRKCATGTLLAAEVKSDAVNRFMNWKRATQSRSYAKGTLAAYVKQQAVLAGFESQGWRQNHHLGRATIAVDMSWCNALLPGLSDMPDNLPARFQEFHHCLTKTAVAWWQNLAINTLKYGLGYVEGLPNVAKVMQTRAYQNFATAVRVAECDSMEKLHCMDAVPHLTQWKLEHVQAVETRVPAAPAAMTAQVQEPPSKRQRVEATAAQTEKQAKIDAMKLQNRQDELDLKLDLQLEAEEQTAHELAQMKDALIRRKMMRSNAEHSTNLTEVLTTGPAMLPSTSVMSQTGQPVSLPDPAAPVPFTTLVEKPKKLPKKNPDLFKSGTISGRNHEWVGDGQCSGIKSQLVPQKNGEGRMRLPKTGHSEEAVDNLRKNRDLPEAIEHLVEQGLSSEAAIALVTKVLKDFGLTTKRGRENLIVKQSSAFFILRSTPADKVGTRLLLGTGRTVMEFEKVYDKEVTLALNNLKHQAV